MATTAIKKPKTAPKPVPQDEAGALIDEAAPPAKKKRSLPKMLMLLTLLLTLLLGGAGGAAWYYFQDDEPAVAIKPATGKAVAAASPKQVSSKPPVFVPLEPFTVNLLHEDASPQYLQVGLALKVTDTSLTDKFKLYMPEIRNRILLLLSGKRASEISTSEGKKALSTELAREVMQSVSGSVPAQGLDSVLFTSFVIQ